MPAVHPGQIPKQGGKDNLETQGFQQTRLIKNEKSK
jgi:hypothetical protein